MPVRLNNLRGAAARSVSVAYDRATRGQDSVDRSAYYRQGWTEAAERGGLTVTDLGGEFLEVVGPAGTLRVMGPVTTLHDQVSWQLAGDKVVSGRLLDEAGARVPEQESYALDDPALRRRLLDDGRELVVKPAADTGAGRGITVGPPNPGLVALAITEAAAFGPRVVVQQRRKGDVARVLVFDDEVLDMVVRRPAGVIGDGSARLSSLVKTENLRRSTLGARNTGFIATGADYKSALARLGTSPRSVPAAGQEVVVSGRSNSGSELESIRERPSAAVVDLAVRCAAKLGVRLCGVDVILDDMREPLGVLEVNTGPGLHWHTLVADEPLDVFGEILTRTVGWR